jgi:hypothetical protein
MLSLHPLRLTQGMDWEQESPSATRIRLYLESLFASRNMALDFRCIGGSSYDEQFRIQIKAFDYYPVASCFKSLVVLYYYFNTPQDAWQDGENTSLYRMAVHSSNVETGVVLDEMSRRVRGRGNAIEKFNDFLRVTVGLANGLHTWNWEGSPTVGLSDPRYAPTSERLVWVAGQSYSVDNVFTASDLARCYDLLARGEYFSAAPTIKAAIAASRRLLSIPAADYRSPIERAYPNGYTGKDGILPAEDVATGRVVDDAGMIQVGDHTYIIAFMSAGESESTVIDVLREVANQIGVYENSGS